MSWLRYNDTSKVLEYSVNDGGTWTTVDLQINKLSLYGVNPTTGADGVGIYEKIYGHLSVVGPDGWDGSGDLAKIIIGGVQHGIVNSYGVGLKLCVYKSGGGGTMHANSIDAVAIDETTGKVTLYGQLETAGAWDDIVIPAVSVNPIGAPSAMAPITDSAGWLGCLLAPAAGTPTAAFSFQLPHAIKLGEDLKFHIHWVKDDAADVTGTVVWEAKFRHLPLQGTASSWTSFSAGTLIIDPSDTRNKSALTSWTLANATYSFGISDIIAVQLQRNGGTSGDAVLLSADIHAKRVRLGSINETSL
jgi:hypothetical protein